MRHISAVVLIFALLAPLSHAQADEYVAAGHVFAFDYGDRAPVSGERLALMIEVFDEETGLPARGLALTLTLAIDDEAREFPLTESDEHAGRYEASFIPTRAGDYLARLAGTVGGQEVLVEAPLPTVRDAALLEFPTREASGPGAERAPSPDGAGRGTSAPPLALLLAALALGALAMPRGGRRA